MHVGVIMDGNGRWAEGRGLPREEGHLAGLGAVRRVVGAAPALGIETLTLFAFSCDNWLRPVREVSGLMRILEGFLVGDAPTCAKKGVRIRAIGRRDRIPERLRRAVESAERATARAGAMLLRLAIDYSGRDAILRAAAGLRGGRETRPEEFGRMIDEAVPEVDLLIRTGGERRLSDFLLWESAYAELSFFDEMWPDFGAEELRRAVDEFGTRERRFGGLVSRGARSTGEIGSVE